MIENDFIYLKSTDIKPLREKLYKEQNGICPICKETMNECALDHQHKLFKNQPIGEDGAGLIRGVCCMTCNSFEGKIFNSHRRLGLHKKEKSLPELLRNLAKYLEQENLPYIHPTEQPKQEKIGKRIFNKVNKLYQEEHPKRKPLEYPKSGKITKVLKELIKKYNIS